jgi:hypothetical protein
MNAPLSNLAGVDLVEVFTLRAEALARLYADSEIDLRTAVDELQQSLEVNGLIAAIGQDAVQAIMSEAFAAARDDLPDAEVQEEFAEADTFAQMCRKADEKQRRKLRDPRIERARALMGDDISLERAYAELNKRTPGDVSEPTLRTAEYLAQQNGLQQMKDWLMLRSPEDRAAIQKHLNRRGPL